MESFYVFPTLRFSGVGLFEGDEMKPVMDEIIDRESGGRQVELTYKEEVGSRQKQWNA